MANDLQATLGRIVSKSEVLLAKYQVLEADKRAADEEIAGLRAKLAEANAELAKLRRDYEFLQIARMVSPTPEAINQNQAILAKMVQDIDKCISQLME